MKKILAAIDFSDVTDEVVECAGKIAKAFDAELILLHSDPFDTTTAVGMYSQNLANDIPMDLEPSIPTVAKVNKGSTNPYEEEEQRIQQHSQKKLDAIIEDLKGKSINADSVLFRGEPEDEILSLAEARNVDMIVVGTHKHSVLHHMLFSELSSNFAAKAPCPVLMVPTTAETD